MTVKGMFRDFITDFPWGLTIILFVSLIIAELLVPFLQYKLIKKPIYKLQEDALKSGKKKFTIFSIMQKGYDWLITLCFKWRKTTVVVGVLFVALGVFLIITTPLELMPIAERNQFAVEVFMPAGTSVERTTEVLDSLERILAKDERVVSIASFHGCSSPRFQATYAPQIGGPNYGQFIVNTKSNEATIEVLNEYTPEYEGYFPDAIVRFKQLNYSNARNPVAIRFSGESNEVLQEVADTVMQIARKVPGLRNIHSSLGNPLMAVGVKPDPTRSQRLGINSVILESTLAARYSSGIPVATMWEGDYGVPVVLKTSGAESGTPRGLLEQPIMAMGFGSVPLGQIATLKPELHYGTLVHYNGVRTVEVIADLQRNMNAVNRTDALLDSISKIQLPEGVTMAVGGEYDVNISTLPEIILGLVISIVIIFFIILFHYTQVGTTTILLCSLLLALPGAGIGMKIQPVDLSITGVLGLVSLMGILVRNAIVLIDYAEELRNQGQTAWQAVYNASKRRMRPIFLTSAAATMGVLPMIIGQNALWKPMGVIIFWGTPITMIFILTVIPAAYCLIKDRGKQANEPLPEPLETHLL